jgi:hypothetical protein
LNATLSPGLVPPLHSPPSFDASTTGPVVPGFAPDEELELLEQPYENARATSAEAANKLDATLCFMRVETQASRGNSNARTDFEKRI